jgi:hypothetical protein
VVTEQRSDGLTVRLFPDGTKEQTSRDGVVLSTLNARAASTLAPGSRRSDDGEVVQTLRVLRDGTLVQHNVAGEWAMIIRRPDGETVQRGRDRETLLLATASRRVLVRGERQVEVLLASGERRESTAELALVRQMRARCDAAAEACRGEFCAEREAEVQAQVRRLAQAEAALIVAAKEQHAARQRNEALRCECEQLRRECEKLRRDHGALASKHAQLLEAHTRSSRRTVVAAAPPAPALASPAVPRQADAMRDDAGSGSARLAKRREPPVMVSAATQWSLHDAQSQLLKRTAAAVPEDCTFDDPVMARAVVTELHRRIEALELEKQDVEDRLIDLRFSLRAEPVSSGKLLSFRRRLKGLIGGSGGGGGGGGSSSGGAVAVAVNPAPSQAALTRPESLRAALVNVKARQEAATLRSQTLESELAELRKGVARALAERDRVMRERDELARSLDASRAECDAAVARRDEALRVVAALDAAALDAAAQAAPASYEPLEERDRDSADSGSMGLLPEIEEEFAQVKLSLSPVSPLF